MKIKRKNFTLFELMISVGLLVILSVVLMRTLVLTSDYWHHSAEQSEMYIDAKIIMSQLNSDISNMIYSRSARVTTAADIAIPLYSSSFTPSNSYTKIENPLISNHVDGWITAMVTRTNEQTTLSGDDDGSGVTASYNSNPGYSNVCKVAYIFYPPVQSGTEPLNSNNNAPGRRNGILVRGFVNENVNSDGMESSGGSSVPYLSGGRTLNNFYSGAMSNIVQLADGVVDFRLTPLSFNGTTFSTVSATTSDGMSNVSALRLTLTMMPVDKLDQYRQMIEDNASDEEKQTFFNKYSRKFTRMYWVNTINP